MASARSFKQAAGQIWANLATAVTGAPSTPAAGTAYRDTTADTVSPDSVEYLNGYRYLNKAPSQVSNQLLFNLSSALDQLQTHGTLGWEPATTYPQGAIVFGSDNISYVSLQNANLAYDPTVSGNQGVWWQSIPPLGRSSFNVNDSITLFGLTLKWGTIPAITQTHQVISFPVAFPNACLNVQITQDWSVQPTWAHAAAVSALTRTGFRVEFSAGISSIGQPTGTFGYYFAIGY